MPRSNATLLMLALATLSAPFALAQNAVSARPGTINYVEGQASIEGHPLTPSSVGHAELQAGQYLATATGKAEILLTPGVFLRVDNNSTLKMVTPDLTHTEVELTQGRASVEVDQLYKQNNILIDLKNGQTQLLKNGLYQFDATAGTVRVFDGEAAAFASVTPQPNEKAIKVKQGKQLAFTGDAAKPASFDRKQAEATDPLYRWSGLRSEYLGEANIALAESYGGASGFAPGWAWSPYSYGYTWLPGGGPFFSPFGYGFYSPGYLYGGGLIYGGYYGGGFGGFGRGYYRGGTNGLHAGFYRGGNAGSRVAGTGSASSFRGNASSGGGSFRGGGGGGGSRGGGGGGHR